jgi:threonine dehydrogenase-like Zn-dependent dehydrogenase
MLIAVAPLGLGATLGVSMVLTVSIHESYMAHGTFVYHLLAEFIVVPFAVKSLIPIPAENATNSDAEVSYLFLSDIFTTGWTAITYSFQPGDSVAVFGAGPVGLLAAYSAILRGASRVYSIDSVPTRLERAASIGAIPISLNGTEGDPVQQILHREPNGVTRSVDCVGYEAVNSILQPQENAIILDMVRVTAKRGGMGTIGGLCCPWIHARNPHLREISLDLFHFR